jgi:hypothetical protein
MEKPDNRPTRSRQSILSVDLAGGRAENEQEEKTKEDKPRIIFPEHSSPPDSRA